MPETITLTELYEHATQYAVIYGGFKTTAQLELIKRAAGRLSGCGDKAEAVNRIERAVDMLFNAVKQERNDQ